MSISFIELAVATQLVLLFSSLFLHEIGHLLRDFAGLSGAVVNVRWLNDWSRCVAWFSMKALQHREHLQRSSKLENVSD